MTHVLRALDLCCGAGGWACAARGLPLRITHAFDRWHDAAMTYKINHPETAVVEIDLATGAALETIRPLAGSVDVVLGGVPCEWLSVFRNGWNPANTVSEEERARGRRLLDACLRIVEVLAPRWWCLEDVVGLVKELPPLMPYQVLDASAYSAQRRRRVFVGEFPPPERGANREVLADHLRPGPYRIGRRTWHRTPATSSAFTADRTYGWDPTEKARTVCGAINSRRDADLSILDETLPGGKRQMEWQEAARLQGFPADYLFFGSPTTVAKQVGQAVQVDLGRAILEAMCRKAQKKRRTPNHDARKRLARCDDGPDSL